jgi:DNA-binding response OmpR family regulator
MKRIVILNDELKTQMQIYLALCDAYRVEIAEDVEAVMYMLRKMHPEILLLDYDLEHFRRNGKSSIDFLRKIRKKYTGLKIMMLLGDEDRADEDKIQEYGADGILYKPVKNRRLLKTIKSLSVNGSVMTP